jgi:hypothetical protein
MVCVVINVGVHEYVALSTYCPLMYISNSFTVAAEVVTGLIAAAADIVTVVAD